MTATAHRRTAHSKPQASVWHSRSLRLALSAVVVLLLAVIYRSATDWLRPDVPPPPPAPTEWTSSEQITRYQQRLRTDPENANTLAALGLAWMQQVRETGDASGYLRAEQALTDAQRLQPDHIDALMGLGILALARHDFQAGLDWGEQALALNPYKAEAVGVLVDAYVELGRYEEAGAAAQRLVDLRPGVAAFSRIAYIRELRGDSAGAIQAMAMAADVPLPGTEAHLWSLTQLGHLHFRQGDWQRAEQTYQTALSYRADYPFAQAGMARVRAARGEFAPAIDQYAALTERLPLPEFLLPLGELYTRTGQPEEAESVWALLRTIQTLNASAGMNTDLEMALFEADFGDPTTALAMAQAAYAQRPSVHAADALAWAHYRNGNFAEANDYAQKALRLGTEDPLLLFHAGRIAYAAGHTDDALAHLQRALALNPEFSILYAPQAREIVSRITNSGQ